MTKKYKSWYWALTIISILLNIAPLFIYIIKGYIAGTGVYQKLALSLTLTIVVILTIVSWINKITLRSKLWIFLIGLYFALDYILSPLIVIAVCQIIDEIIVSPIRNITKSKLIIHKELDKRL